MAITAERPPVPRTVGNCRYCHLGLYENAPVIHYPGGDVAHVACELDARRQNRGEG